MLLRSIVQSLPSPATVENQHSSTFRPRSLIPRRFRTSFFVLVVLGAISLLFYLTRFSISSHDDLLVFLKDLPKPEGGRLPPRFYEWHDREKQLPQHDPDLPYPQGREGRYIRFSNQVWGTFPLS